MNWDNTAASVVNFVSPRFKNKTYPGGENTAVRRINQSMLVYKSYHQSEIDGFIKTNTLYNRHDNHVIRCQTNNSPRSSDCLGAKHPPCLSDMCYLASLLVKGLSHPVVINHNHKSHIHIHIRLSSCWALVTIRHMFRTLIDFCIVKIKIPNNFRLAAGSLSGIVRRWAVGEGDGVKMNDFLVRFWLPHYCITAIASNSPFGKFNDWILHKHLKYFLGSREIGPRLKTRPPKYSVCKYFPGFRVHHS